MGDRCLSARDDAEVLRLKRASVVVRPVVEPLPGTAWNRVTHRTGREWGWENPNAQPIHQRIEIRDAPLAPGDTMVAREAWRGVFHDDVYGVQYRADMVVRWLGDGVLPMPSQWCLPSENPDRYWLGPQRLPAALARIRRRVGSVTPWQIEKVSPQTWRGAGFSAGRGVRLENEMLRPRIVTTTDSAREWWLSRYGPGSWSGWVWVMGLEVSGE